MRLTKFSRVTLVSFFWLALLTSFGLNLISPTAIAQQSAQTLAFTAQQGQGETFRGSLFTIQANGLERRDLTPSLNEVYPTLVWSPQGQRLAFVSGETDIYAVNADGSRLTQLFSGDFCKASSFNIAWLSNQNLVFTRSCDGFTSDTPGNISLYTSNSTGIAGTKLIQRWQAGGIPPKTEISSGLYLSPNGQQVAFFKDQNIYKMNTDGSGLRKLTNTPGDYTSGGSQLIWSPDGRQIAFFYGQYPQQQIYVINADGTNLTNLTNNPDFQVFNTNLFWSPDSTRIAYYHDPVGDTQGNQQDIYLLDVNRKTARNLTQNPGQYNALSWSPDGQWLAFVAGDFSNQKLYTIKADGSNKTELLPQFSLSGVYDLAWSSDSQQIAFTSNEAEKSNLYVVKRDGKGLTQLTNEQDLSAYAPSWQP